MMSSDHIIEVDEASFQNEVVAYSSTIPVAVLFWAEWSQPSHALTPLLEKLATEMNGAFRLAKINADETPNLNIRLGVHSLPAVIAFHRGQLVEQFDGVQSETYLREFLGKLVPAAGSLELERANGLLKMKRYLKAAKAFRKSLKVDPDNGPALLGLAKALIAQGEAGDALGVLINFPEGREFTDAENLADLGRSLAKLKTDPDHFLRDDLGASFHRALTLISKGNLPAGADGLLGILKEDKRYLDGEARRAMVGLLVLMDDDDPETRQYRNEFASVLF
jgi:putative thioredoxin